MNLTRVGLLLYVEHYEQCVAFYRDKLQLPVTQVKDGLTELRFGMGYLMLEQGGVAARAMKLPAQNPVVLRFDVADVQQAAAELRERGVPVDVQSFDWGVVGAFADPDGNPCELKSPS